MPTSRFASHSARTWASTTDIRNALSLDASPAPRLPRWCGGPMLGGPPVRPRVSTSMPLLHMTSSEHLSSTETAVSCHDPVLYHGLTVRRMVIHRYPMQSPRIRCD